MALEPSSNVNNTLTHKTPNSLDEEVKVMVPPLNFAMVAPGVYRSGHPNHDFNEELNQFVKDQNIQ
ncbi:11608_t:CDS:2, partial [Racocetra persica]